MYLSIYVHFVHDFPLKWHLSNINKNVCHGEKGKNECLKINLITPQYSSCDYAGDNNRLGK